jgi:hypothetical protein
VGTKAKPLGVLLLLCPQVICRNSGVPTDHLWVQEQKRHSGQAGLFEMVWWMGRPWRSQDREKLATKSGGFLRLGGMGEGIYRISTERLVVACKS